VYVPMYGDSVDIREAMGTVCAEARALAGCLFAVWNLQSASNALAATAGYEAIGETIHDKSWGGDAALLRGLGDLVRAGKLADDTMVTLTGWHAAEWT